MHRRKNRGNSRQNWVFSIWLSGSSPLVSICITRGEGNVRVVTKEGACERWWKEGKPKGEIPGLLTLFLPPPPITARGPIEGTILVKYVRGGHVGAINNKKDIRMTMKFFPQRKTVLLFFSSNMAATNILHRGRVSLVIVIHSSVTDKPRRKKAIAKIKKIASRTNDHWIKTGTATKALELKKKNGHNKTTWV